MPRHSGFIDISNATGSRRYTVSVQDRVGGALNGDLLPGAQIMARVDRTLTGTTQPDAPDSITVTLKAAGSGSTVRTIATYADTLGRSDNFAFTLDGTDAAAAAAGTLEVDVRITRTGGVVPYNVSSDGTGTQTTSTGQTVTRSRCWLRANTSLTVRSGIGTTATNTTVLAYGDEFGTVLTAGHPVHGPATVTVNAVEQPSGTTKASASLSLGTAGSVSGLISSVVNNTFTAARHEFDLTASVQNLAVSSLPAFAPTSVTDAQSPAVDPRITVVRHMQHNSKDFGTPPSGEDDGIQRLTSDLSFLSTRFLNARSEGLNGLTVSRALFDGDQLASSPASPNKSDAARSTTDVNGEAGWLNTFIVWDAALPGGTWLVRHTALTANTSGLYAVEGVTAAGSTFDTIHSLVAADPNLRMVCAAGPAQEGQDTRHFSPGEPLLVGMAVFNVTTATTVTLNSEPALAPRVAIGRFNVTLGRAEYLDADKVTWKAVTGNTVHFHAMSVSQGDPRVWTVVLANTSGFSGSDIFVIGKAAVQGVPVSSFQKEPVVNGINNHTAYTFDGAGFVGFPTR